MGKGEKRTLQRAIAQRLVGDRIFPGKVLPNPPDWQEEDDVRTGFLVRQSERERENCQRVRQWVVYYADGSLVRNGRMGAGVCWATESNGEVSKENGYHYHLGTDSGSSTDAELWALSKALELALEDYSQRERLDTVYVYTDSRSVLEILLPEGNKALIGPIWEDMDDGPLAIEAVFDHAEHLAQLGVELVLSHVKGHKVSKGNQLADELAKRGAQSSKRKERMEFAEQGDAPPKVQSQGEEIAQEWARRKREAVKGHRASTKRNLPHRAATPPVEELDGDREDEVWGSDTMHVDMDISSDDSDSDANANANDN